MDLNYKPSSNDPLRDFGRNLNDEVVRGKVDPTIGRDEEIKRITEIISRKSKNNPVLIGEPGVGKTAIVEGLAARIVAGDVPQNLKDKEIYEISLASLIAGAKFQGEFEERIQKLLKQVKDSNGQKILFIDEIHQVVGMGRNSSNSAMDAANILKPMMARGEIKVIGATTLNEYREYIEKDAALERRMQKIMVAEPDEQEALTIMRGLKERWELFHGVKIHDSALVAAVRLSGRYIADKYLPDKAIDLVDEAAAKVKTEINSTPRELESLSRRLAHLETERFSLSNETDEKSKKRTAAIEKDIAELKKQKDEMSQKWNAERKDIEEIVELKKELEDNKVKVDRYLQEGLYEKAAKVTYTTIPALQKRLVEKENDLKDNELAILKDSVTESEIAEVLARATGVPVARLLESEKEKLLSLPAELRQSVKGQEPAITAVANAVLRGRAGINDPNKPIGSFLFAGPTGVGKTEVARALARTLFDSEKAIMRLDMSEFMEKHAVSKLIGAPPGYVGYEQAGMLTEGVRRKPYSVVLLDEIEKAHPDVLNVLLQLLDDGKLTDSHGREVNFKNTIVIMTTNMGNELAMANRKDEARLLVEKSLRPEFINRVDELIIFSPLSERVVEEIAEKLINELKSRLEAQDIIVEFDPSLIKSVAKDGFDPQYGARPLKRFINKNIENELARMIVSGAITKGVPFQFAGKHLAKNAAAKTLKS